MTYLDALRRSFQDFEARIADVFLVEYEVQEKQTSEFLREGILNEPLIDAKTVHFHDVMFSVDARYARKEGRVHTSHAGPLVSPLGELEPTERRRVRVFDGTKVVRHENVGKSQYPKLVFEVSSDPRRALEAYMAPWQASGQQLFLQALDYREKDRKRCTSSVFVSDSGTDHARLTVEMSWEGGMQYSAVLDLDGFRLREFIAHEEKGRLAQKFTADDYVEIDGIAIPNKSRMEQFGEAGVPVKTCELSVSRFTTTPAEIDDALFTLEIPAGSAIRDLDRGVVNADPSEYQDLFGSNPAKANKTTLILLLNCVAFGVVLVAFAARRWIATRRGIPQSGKD